MPRFHQMNRYERAGEEFLVFLFQVNVSLWRVGTDAGFDM